MSFIMLSDTCSGVACFAPLAVLVAGIYMRDQFLNKDTHRHTEMLRRMWRRSESEDMLTHRLKNVNYESHVDCGSKGNTILMKTALSFFMSGFRLGSVCLALIGTV